MAKKKFRLKYPTNLIKLDKLSNWPNVGVVKPKVILNNYPINLNKIFSPTTINQGWWTNKQIGYPITTEDTNSGKYRYGIFNLGYYKNYVFGGFLDDFYFYPGFLSRSFLVSYFNSSFLYNYNYIKSHSLYKTNLKKNNKNILLNKTNKIQMDQLGYQKWESYLESYKVHYSVHDVFSRILNNKSYYSSLHWNNNFNLKLQLNKISSNK